jgi:hypothetical protein
MATLGALMSQQLGFTCTTTAGTIYTHGLGFTPTVVLLTIRGTSLTGTVPLNYFYTLANDTTITVGTSPTAGAGGTGTGVDILCGSLHSLIK